MTLYGQLVTAVEHAGGKLLFPRGHLHLCPRHLDPCDADVEVQANPNAEPASEATASQQARQQELTHLLDELNRVNAQNDALQRSVGAAEVAPGRQALIGDDVLSYAIAAQRQQDGTLQVHFGRLEQTGAKRDDVFGADRVAPTGGEIKRDIAALFDLPRHNTLGGDERVEAIVKEAEAELLAAKSLKDKLWLIPDLSQTSEEPLSCYPSRAQIRLNGLTSRPRQS